MKSLIVSQKRGKRKKVEKIPIFIVYIRGVLYAFIYEWTVCMRTYMENKVMKLLESQLLVRRLRGHMRKDFLCPR